MAVFSMIVFVSQPQGCIPPIFFPLDLGMYGEMEEEYVSSEFRCHGGKDILVLELSWVGVG